LVKELLSKFTKKKILFKKPNDLLIDKKKISGILQEVILINNNKFLITGIGINITKNPIIKNYPATNLQEVTKKSISKTIVEKKLRQIFEKNLFKLYRIK
jgi:BirA family biotin operon repressor/biotin-[acetyl-CoA-carboxylase] ligase